MNNDDIEKFRPLANNTKHLIQIILEKMTKEACEIGHEMSGKFQEFYNFGGQGVVYSYCKYCAYEIEIELITTDKKEEKIYVKEIAALKKLCEK
jgi:hypothetical protein